MIQECLSNVGNIIRVNHFDTSSPNLLMIIQGYFTDNKIIELSIIIRGGDGGFEKSILQAC